jgi:flagellin-specific chaperone FliS
MLISSELKQTNIAEYILYMWQTEDIIRSFDFDIEKIKSDIVDKYDVSDEIERNIISWYDSIIQMSEQENIKKSGHLQILRNIVNDLYDLHLWLLSRPDQVQYKQTFDIALPHIKALEEKMKGTAENDVDVCLHGLYAIMLLKMQQKEINKDTQAAIETFRKLIALLAAKYKEREEHPEKYY